MGKTVKTHENDSQPTSEKSGWSAFATITTFDRGSSNSQQISGKTITHKRKKENAVVPKRMATFTPPSLFVESLIDQLCKLFEKDPLSQKKMYHMICRKLCEMKLIDKTYMVEEFQFMRSYYQKALYHLLTVSNSPAIDCKLEKFLNHSPSCLSLTPTINSSNFDFSRYQTEFEEIEFIARGGFGRVFRVRNKVDGCEYAIKKICLRYHCDEHFMRSLREVRMLANLDHCNIVAYKAAWFEPLSGVTSGGDGSSSSGSKVSPEVDASDEVPDSSTSEREGKDEPEDDSGNIVFASGNEDASGELTRAKSNLYGTKEVSYTHHLTGNNNGTVKGAEALIAHVRDSVKTLSFSEHIQSLCDHSSGSNNKGCRGRKVPGSKRSIECAVLHIQMQLCKESLRKWLDLRNEAFQYAAAGTLKEDTGELGAECPHAETKPHLDSASVITVLRIFHEILNGVEYIHSEGIVHHDLKPSNIFVEGFEYKPIIRLAEESGPSGRAETSHFPTAKEPRSQVRVGDFGLACHFAQPPATGDSELQVSEDLKESAMTLVPARLVGSGNCLVQTENAAKDGRGDENIKEFIGTRLYAAPEQLEGHCNFKSDMYSLGIILFELLHPFFTGMERVKVITALRSNGNVPVDFECWYPLLASLIKDMLSLDPESRPSIKYILKVIESLLPDNENIFQERSDSIWSDDMNIVKEYYIGQRRRTSSFTQTYEHKVQEQFSQAWEEVFLDDSHVSNNFCGSMICHIMRDQQEETIAKLREENMRKDETIRQLKLQIEQFQNSSMDLVKNKHVIL